MWSGFLSARRLERWFCFSSARRIRRNSCKIAKAKDRTIDDPSTLITKMIRIRLSASILSESVMTCRAACVTTISASQVSRFGCSIRIELLIFNADWSALISTGEYLPLVSQSMSCLISSVAFACPSTSGMPARSCKSPTLASLNQLARA